MSLDKNDYKEMEDKVNEWHEFNKALYEAKDTCEKAEKVLREMAEDSWREMADYTNTLAPETQVHLGAQGVWFPRGIK